MMKLETIAATLAALSAGLSLSACLKTGSREGTEVPGSAQDTNPPEGSVSTKDSDGDGASDGEGVCAGEEGVCAGDSPGDSGDAGGDDAPTGGKGLVGLMLPKASCSLTIEWEALPKHLRPEAEREDSEPLTVKEVAEHLRRAMRGYEPVLRPVQGGVGIISRPESFEKSGEPSTPRFEDPHAGPKRPSTFAEYMRDAFSGQTSRIRLFFFVISDEPQVIDASLGSTLDGKTAIEVPYREAKGLPLRNLPTTEVTRKHQLILYVFEVSRSAEDNPYEPSSAVLCEDHLSGSGIVLDASK